MLYPDMNVIESDERGISIEFRPQYVASKKILADGYTFELPQFKFGYSSLTTDPGNEDIRIRVIPIAIPSYRENVVSVIASDYESVSSFSLAPVPSVEVIDDLGASKKKYQTKFVSQNNFYPQQIAELKNVAMVKGLLIGSLVIIPYQYQSATKTLKRYSRIVVRIDFGPKVVSNDNSGNDDWAKATLLNYSVAKKWTSMPSLKKTTIINSVLATGTWIKMEVVDEGMYKIDAGYLRSVGIEPSSLSSITDIKIFGADGRGIPENLNVQRPADLPQVAVEYIDKNANGKLDPDDYLLFYGQGITGWNYDPARKIFSHYVNPYTFSNYYFLNVGSDAPVKRIQPVNVATSSGGKLNHTIGKVFFDEDKYNFIQSGQMWVSSPMYANESRVVINKLPGWISGTSVTYRYHLYSRSTDNATFKLEESATTISSESIDGKSEYDLNSPVTTFANETTGERTITPILVDQMSKVMFTYATNSSVASGFIDWLTIFYREQLTALNDILVFASPDTNGVVEFSAAGFSTDKVNVYEVSDMNNVRKISYVADQALGSLLFKDTLKPGATRKYWAGTDAKYLSPKSFVKIPNSNLHGLNGAEFIIITHNDFLTEALRLKNHKENLPGAKKISTVVVEVDKIYNEFGIGMPDPVAMRDFIRYAVNNWVIKPKYVLFFGDASYDFRSILKNDRSWIPTYQTAESNDKIESLSNEDFFSYIDNNAPYTVSIAHGRLTPRSLDDARLIVDRIIRYETKAPNDIWKNTITVVADDKWAPEDQSEDFHTWQVEQLVSGSTPKDFEVKRIYMEEYPVAYSSAGRRKPDARKAIIDQVNKGSLLLNYTGHGNPKVWAHESVLTLDDVRSVFVNSERLTFIIAATCDWGRFEEAGEPSSAEESMLNRKGGAIGVLSATRAVYSYENAETNQYFYSYLFSIKPVMRLGDAYLLTKNSLWGLQNKQKYFLLGDPTLRLAVPEGDIHIDSLSTLTSAVVDTIHALEKIIIKATVRDTLDAVRTNYGGTATITIFDSDQLVIIPTISGFQYYKNGAVLYKGESSIISGIMSSSFVVPKDIAYQNKNGRISIYFSNALSDGKGYTRNFIVGGTSKNVQQDSLGPNISIYFDNTNFRNGEVVGENPTLIVNLNDSSGINSSTNSIGHRLEAWIDASAKSIDLTEFYIGKIDSYQAGSAKYQMSDLSQGNHSIKVRAWDVQNNSSYEEAFFVVASSNSLSIQQLYNFPNPITTRTSFTFQHNQLIPIDVKINIYTVAGRLIHSIDRYAISDRFVKIDWDRRDSDGDEVGNGVYFYKVIAKTIDGKFASEAISKLAIVR